MNRKQKHQFKSHYCQTCQQRKSCQLLNHEECCPCFYQREREKAQEYSSVAKILAVKQKEQADRIQQLKLLRDYSGCKHCNSKEADAYPLYTENKLVCQPCLIKKVGHSTSPISFAKESQWFKKRWGINLGEWLTNYDCLPINWKCATKWLKDKWHLNNCACLKQESQELYELFTNSLKEKAEKLAKCACESSQKVRVRSDDLTWCESCKKRIEVASKKRVIKNRNDPRFWGLDTPQKILCGDCLETRKGAMKSWRRAEFNRYRKVGRL